MNAPTNTRYRHLTVQKFSGSGGADVTGVDLSQDVPDEVLGEIRAALPDLKERFEKSGGEVWDFPDDKLIAFVTSEHETWTKLIREAGIKLD